MRTGSSSHKILIPAFGYFHAFTYAPIREIFIISFLSCLCLLQPSVLGESDEKRPAMAIGFETRH
ncbi:hypothetical protein B9Z19DRAFT_1073371 [Tuber borchii]|uniref:Uncharacterized protein n=1 Tax=Tuber borchii TaxID=42251 RepID=A0A2T7A5T9_TUBBO|nr:hypothetical protein B9Z19DRAFT_1073371 [Tuber borchii]